jgi:hypothetical protein
MILQEFHEGFGTGHFATYITANNFFDVGYLWPKLFHDPFEFYRYCDACQKAGGLAM